MTQSRKRSLKILVSAGATRDPIDPVRFITNRATGVLGYCIAQIARAAGEQRSVTETLAQRIDQINALASSLSGDADNTVNFGGHTRTKAQEFSRLVQELKVY